MKAIPYIILNLYKLAVLSPYTLLYALNTRLSKAEFNADAIKGSYYFRSSFKEQL